MARFIQFPEQVVAIDSIVKVDRPRKTTDIDWTIRTVLNSSCTNELTFLSSYTSEEKAKDAYSKIVQQLCSDK